MTDKKKFTPTIKVMPIADGATPDSHNVNKHTQRGAGLLENELRKRGAFRSIASAGKDTETPVVYAGNLTLEKAVDIGFQEIVNVYVDGSQLVNVVRVDLEPNTAEAIALGISDNEIGKQSYNPDIDVIAALTVGENAVLAALKEQDGIFGGLVDGMTPYQIDYEKEWQGMPEFEQKDLSAAKQIVVSFATMDDYKEFSELIKQNLTEKTRGIWYPYQRQKDVGIITDEP